MKCEDWNCADTSDLLLEMQGVRQGLRSLLNISSGLPQFGVSASPMLHSCVRQQRARIDQVANRTTVEHNLFFFLSKMNMKELGPETIQTNYK